jgi:hypothetical protein
MCNVYAFDSPFDFCPNILILDTMGGFEVFCSMFSFFCVFFPIAVKEHPYLLWLNMAATDSRLVSCFLVPPCSYYLMLANVFHLIVFSLTWNFKHRSNLVMGFFLMVRLGNSKHFVEICNLSDPLTPETTSPLSDNSAVVWDFVELWLFRRKVTRVISQRLDLELTCSVCLEQVKDGELVRSLPCLHQVRIYIVFLSWSILI